MVAMASLFMSPSDTTHNKNHGLLDTFIDSVKTLSVEDKTLIVSFRRQAEQFKISQDHPQYADIKEKLEKAQKITQKIKVIAIIPSMTIKEVKV